ncbi:hypothetical protein RBH26_09405 [Natronolimnohabitans sp. A-GB9]|uniref:hypothetical protein n=1 Tax=Natronolimnohabitans sp. A-GB9 TaxID=3069757 RepID=UPI0027AF72DA|nr:hypothetical protein [Natronolimnohabitans sp. A-GB9]MDQ2050704.1 hypothetical protein [Natronolimnohabitans sp. A-GB9]
MTDDTGSELPVDDVVDYCHTQAGLLSGRVETMREEADALLAEIDEEMAELRGQLEDHANATPGTDGPSTPAGPDGGENGLDLDTFEDREREVKEKQLLVQAKQTRMQAFQDLAADYTELAAELQTEVDDGDEALTRVVEFEADRDAPAYFEERETMVEAATNSESADE